jgi:hypothetical protein
MQSERIAEASALSGSVRGLGVCDALRVELVAEQLPGLIEQLDAHSAALRDEIERRGAAAIPGDPRGAAQLEEAESELRLIELLRGELPPMGETSEPFLVIGPAGPIGAMVRGAMRHAVETLSELVLATSRHDAGGRDRLAHAAAAAAAWVRDLRRGAGGRGLQPRRRARPRIGGHQPSRPSNVSCVPSASAAMRPVRASTICSSALT